MALLATCSCANPTHRRVHVFDAARSQRQQERKWKRAKAAETEYSRQLRAVAEQVGKLVEGLAPADPVYATTLEHALRQYAHLIKPWAESVAGRMLADVDRRDWAMWESSSREMGLALRTELKHAATGQLLKDMQRENVDLITSLPLEAAQRVHELSLRAMETSSRGAEIVEDIMRTGEVTKSRAVMIARTEVARAASGLIEARATSIGSEGYIWRTSQDSDVRNKDGNPKGSHRKLEGKFIKWDSPPVASTSGDRYHAGQGPNCRCWPEPVLPREF